MGVWKYIWVCVFILIFKADFCWGQETLYYPGLDNNIAHQLIKKDTLGYYYIINGDTSKIIFVSKNWRSYKLYNKSYTLLTSGDLGGKCYSDYFKKFDEWIDYFPNGNPTVVKHFDADEPCGSWVYYFENGNKKKEFHYKKITEDYNEYTLDSLYVEYYPNGQYKIKGQYKVIDGLDSVPLILDDGTTKTVLQQGKMGAKTGTWYYYNENGSLLKKEEYVNGELVK